MRLWLSIIAICFAGPALAGQAGVMTLGVGQRSCGQFIAAVGQAPLGATVQRKSQDGGRFYAELIRYHEWIMGFVTGYNSAYEEEHRYPDQGRHISPGSLDAEVVQRPPNEDVRRGRPGLPRRERPQEIESARSARYAHPVWYDGLGLTEGMTMSESSAETARLMNVVEAIVAELERQGVAQTLDDLSFDLMAMARPSSARPMATSSPFSRTRGGRNDNVHCTHRL